MIAVLILDNAGNVIYRSTCVTQRQPTEANIIRFLPLLLAKDLFKANFHDCIRYVHHRNKTIAFLEKHGLLYIVWTRRGAVPADMLQHHLHVVDRLLHFQFGPHWHAKVQGITTWSRPLRWRGTPISTADIASCLARLPWLVARAPPRLYSPTMMCCVEQVELQQDLRQRLTESLKTCCDAAFGSTTTATTTTPLWFASLFAATPPAPRRMLNLSPLMMRHHPTAAEVHHHAWTDAFLFARDKLVVRCSNDGELHDSVLPSATLLFLKTMASEYAEQAAAREDIAEQRAAAAAHPSATGGKPHNTAVDASYDDESTGSPSPTPQPSSSDATSQKSSITYIYDSSSISAPFKIREKSASSVTVASSNCSTPSLSWSSPPALMHNQLLSRLSRKSLDSDDRPQPELRRWSSLTRPPPAPPPQPTLPPQPQPQPQPPQPEPVLSSQLPPNATIFHTSFDEKPPDIAALPNSLPLEASGFGLARHRQRQSAPSSPASRSRSQSNAADRLSARTSLRHMFSTFLQTEQQQQQQHNTTDDEMAAAPHEGKVMTRWVKWNHHMTLCIILLVHLGDGLCAAVIFKQQHEDERTEDELVCSDRMTNHSAVKALRTSLQEHLKDFYAFLLTKETTHFSILSFLAIYPGLLHFIHVRHGSMLSPRMVDLVYLNQDHDLLLEMGEKYQECCGETTPRWGWPSVARLEQLCDEMVRVAGPTSATAEFQVCQIPGHPGFQCASRRASGGECLMALYFSFIPEAVVVDMHHRLFHDVSQRLLE